MEQAQALLHGLAEWSTLAVGTMAVLVALAGSVQGFVSGIAWVFSRAGDRSPVRRIWLRYARWLVAALTFQLAADIIDTTLAPTFEDIGRLAAIAVVRTFLNYFLERDIREITEPAKEDAEL